MGGLPRDPWTRPSRLPAPRGVGPAAVCLRGAASSRLSPGLLPGDAPSHRRLHEADSAATPSGATAALRAPDTVTV